MRRLVLILVWALSAAAEEPLLHEERAWVGLLEVDSETLPLEGVEGAETQAERLEFLLVTRPPRTSIARPRLLFEMRETSGSWSLAIDTREGEGRETVHAKGEDGGRLHGRVAGWIEPGTRRYRLVAEVQPDRLVAMTTMSGLWKERFTTRRLATGRRPLLQGFEAEGEADSDLRRVEGSRVFVDNAARLPRKVTVRWRLERVDPVIRGRAVDHAGRPLAGVRAVATTTNAERIRRRLPPLVREATSDDEGRFAIEAYWARWDVEVEGLHREGTVIEGARIEGGVDLRFDRPVDLDLRLNAYRLETLPWAHLLDRYFRGDVDAYLRYVRERVPDARMEASLLPAPAPGE